MCGARAYCFRHFPGCCSRREPKKYALPMQCWLLKQRFVTYVSALRAILSGDLTTPGVILDRSVGGCRLASLRPRHPILIARACYQIFSDIVFAEKNFFDENFSREGYDFYLTLRKQMLSLLPAPHVVLYLDVPAEECYQRIHKLRKRVCAPVSLL
jgi:deoxyadenosine/deoxycytidine kinase